MYFLHALRAELSWTIMLDDVISSESKVTSLNSARPASLSAALSAGHLILCRNYRATQIHSDILIEKLVHKHKNALTQNNARRLKIRNIVAQGRYFII